MSDKKNTKETRMEWHKKNAGFQADSYFEAALNSEDLKAIELQIQLKKFCKSNGLRLNSFTLQVIQKLISKILKDGLSPKKAQEILVAEFGENSSISDKEKSYLDAKKI